jgi:hypothetical protein
MKNKFILGACFALIGIPIAQTIAETIYSSSELIKSKINVKILEQNLKITRLQDEIQFYDNMDEIIFESSDDGKWRDK